MSEIKSEELKPLSVSQIWIRGNNCYIRDVYEFKPPIFGKSNTDQSYYEPRSSSIANLLKSASNAPSIGLYDFTEELPKKSVNGKEVVDVEKAKPILEKMHTDSRKVSALRSNRGADIAEISQLENDAREDFENTLIDQKREVSDMQKQLKFVGLAKEKLSDKPTQDNSGSV